MIWAATSPVPGSKNDALFRNVDGDDPVFVGGGVHARAGELRGLSGVEHKLGAFLRQASPALGILDVVTDLHADAAEVEVEHVVRGAGPYAAFQHDLPFGTDPIQHGVDLDVPTGQPSLAVDHDGGVRAGGVARIVEKNTAEDDVGVVLARLGREGLDDRVIERDGDLGGGARLAGGDRVLGEQRQVDGPAILRARFRRHLVDQADASARAAR